MERGGAPPEKAADWDLRGLAGGSLLAMGPQAQQARRSAAIASWWQLREIEQAGIRLHTTHCKVQGGSREESDDPLTDLQDGPNENRSGKELALHVAAYWTGWAA